MKDNKITIKDKGKVYIFQVETMLKTEDMQKIREHLQKQITEGCVLLPPYIKLLNKRWGNIGKKLGF